MLLASTALPSSSGISKPEFREFSLKLNVSSWLTDIREKLMPIGYTGAIDEAVPRLANRQKTRSMISHEHTDSGGGR
jgi:hypothetical protein